MRGRFRVIAGEGPELPAFGQEVGNYLGLFLLAMAFVLVSLNAMRVGLLTRFLGYLGTWSATKQYVRAHGSDPLDRFGPEFAAAWGDPAAVRVLRWAFNVRLGRVG